MQTLDMAKWRDVFKKSFPDQDKYAAIYKDLHQHPELPCQEARTAGVVADHLESLGFQVPRKIGGHGVVGILSNGRGKTVLLRSEPDALPIKEETGLPYMSHAEQVDADGCTRRAMHGCGHDMHMASLLGAADLMGRLRGSGAGRWSASSSPTRSDCWARAP
jgi:metal-dependent amidase/aminoacylase/carboxypeptidase family protein